MSSFRINLALVKKCPPLLTLKTALETLGRPSDKDYGVMGVSDIIDDKLTFEFFKTREQTMPRVDKQDGSIQTPTVKKDDTFKASIRMAGNSSVGVMELYTGSAATMDKVAELFAVMELSDQVPLLEAIELDIMRKVNDVREGAKQFQLVSAKVKQYKDATDGAITGTYTVKFPKDMEAANSISFCQEHADNLESVKVRVKRDELTKAIAVTIRPTAFFTLSAPDADETKALNVCRILAGTMQPRVPRPPEVVQPAA